MNIAKININRKVVVTFLAIVGAVLIVSFFTKKETKIIPGTQPLPKPIIPNAIETGFNIQSKIEEKDFPSEKSAPLLTRERTSPFSEDDAREIASKMGFSGEPRVVDDIFSGNTYYWIRTPESLIVYSGTRSITYNYNQYNPVPDKKLSNAAIIRAAEEFLTKNSLFNKEDISFSYFTYLSSPPGEAEGLYFSSKDDASINLVNFSSVESDKKLVTLDPRSSPISVWVLPNEQITKAEITHLGKLAFSEEEYSLKDSTEFASRLKEAIIISLDDGNISLQDVTNDVGKIEVLEIELVYLAESSETKVFQPIYLLKGKAIIKGIPDEVNAVLYLPAISESR